MLCLRSLLKTGRTQEHLLCLIREQVSECRQYLAEYNSRHVLQESAGFTGHSQMLKNAFEATPFPSAAGKNSSDLIAWLSRTRKEVKTATESIQGDLDRLRTGRKRPSRATQDAFNAMLNCGHYSVLCLDASLTHAQWQVGEGPAVAEVVPLAEVVELCIDRARAFSHAKNSTCPLLYLEQIGTSDDKNRGQASTHTPANYSGLLTAARPRTVSSIPIVSGFVHYALFELTKNAITACIRRYGALDVDEISPPIVWRVDRAKRMLELTDAGCGMAPETRRHLGDYCHSSWSTGKDVTEPSYTYSKDFGETFSGQGVGVPRALLALKFHEVRWQIASKENQGTTVSLKFPHLAALGADCS